MIWYNWYQWFLKFSKFIKIISGYWLIIVNKNFNKNLHSLLLKIVENSNYCNASIISENTCN